MEGDGGVKPLTLMGEPICRIVLATAVRLPKERSVLFRKTTAVVQLPTVTTFRQEGFLNTSGLWVTIRRSTTCFRSRWPNSWISGESKGSIRVGDRFHAKQGTKYHAPKCIPSNEKATFCAYTNVLFRNKLTQ